MPLQYVCNPLCARRYAEVLKAKRERLARRQEKKEAKAALEKIKPKAKWLKEAQVFVNRYVRWRDRNEGCISCGTKADVQYAAGHFRSRGAASHLRFNLDNIHKQCNRRCNLALSGNLLEYEKGLIKRIGIERVEALKNNNDVCIQSIDEIKAIKKHFQELCKEIEK